MPNNILKIGTRSSRLAVWQAEKVKTVIESRYPDIEIQIKHIKTTGDKITDKSLIEVGGKGIFTKEIEESLSRNEIDFAIHSLKDLPTELPEGLTIGAVLERDYAEDALLAKENDSTFENIRHGGIIATGSVRRSAQLLHMRPDLNIVDLRGNVETRIKKLYESDWDGIIIARAGVERLGLGNLISCIIPVEQMLTAVCQGIIGIEVNKESEFALEIANSINHSETYLISQTERAFLRAFSGGCSNPLAAYAKIDENTLILEGMVASPDGKKLYRDKISGSLDKPEDLGIVLAKNLIMSGAVTIMKIS